MRFAVRQIPLLLLSLVLGCAEEVKRSDPGPLFGSIDSDDPQSVDQPQEDQTYSQLADCAFTSSDKENLTFACTFTEALDKLHFQGILFTGGFTLISPASIVLGEGNLSATIAIPQNQLQGVEEILLVGQSPKRLIKGVAAGIGAKSRELQLDRSVLFGFVTSALGPEFGGANGADAKCQELALAAGFSGRWAALAYPEFWKRWAPYYKSSLKNLAGDLLAAEFTQFLQDGALATPLLQLDLTPAEEGTYFWLGSSIARQLGGFEIPIGDCLGFRYSGSDQGALVGTLGQSKADFLVELGLACNQQARLLCVSQVLTRDLAKDWPNPSPPPVVP